ncbi:DUF2800 domain-containing protein [Alloscardovia omnicolens]|uniref:DUF2800 domain-containing protein n=1 Tax=Alloscardovia omnicolens TaxID=419015 RepID=UPI003A63D7A9
MRRCSMPSKHALLSPSAAHRWIECPPSAKLSAEYKDEASSYAMEGTDAHTLGEYKLACALGREADDPRESLSYLNEEMEACTDIYASFVTETLSAIKATTADPLVHHRARGGLFQVGTRCFWYSRLSHHCRQDAHHHRLQAWPRRARIS